MKHREEIESEVRTLIASTLSLNDAEITVESIIADLSADSIQLFELLIAFEKFYGIETAYEDIVALRTVNDIIDYIQSTHTGTHK